MKSNNENDINQMKDELLKNKNNINKNNEIIKTYEEKIKKLNKEIEILKSKAKNDNENNSKIIKDYINEIEELKNIEKQESLKNEQIIINLNEKLEITEKEKEQYQKNSNEFQLKINQLNNEIINITKQLELNIKEKENIITESQSKIKEFQKQNEALKIQYNKLIEEDKKIMNNNNLKLNEQIIEMKNKITNLTEENNLIKSQMSECINISSDKYKLLNDNISKSKNKLESLMNVYKYHIEYLKENFINTIQNFKILINTLNKKDFQEEMIEQFNGTILTILKSIDLMNQISEREALITNYKSEIKSLKATIKNYKEKINQFQIEQEKKETILLTSHDLKNENINTITSITSVRNNENILLYDKLILKLKEIENNVELNQINNNLLSDNNNFKSQINLLNDMNETLKQRITEIENEYKNLKIQNTNNSDLNQKEAKNLKNEIKTLMDELYRIKETWVSADKKKEYINTIDSLEKNNKILKDDINKKKEYISQLKETIEKNNNEMNLIQSKTKKESSINNEIKNLKIDNNRKENIIKELKNNLEIYKNKEKKKLEEKDNISDKIKKLTNDINLKDSIIKDLKEKYEKIQNNSNIIEIQNKTINNNNAEQKKLKDDLAKKEQLIKTLKHKNFSLSMELKETQTKQIKQNKNNTDELIKEQQSHSKTKNQLDDYHITLEKMISCLRKILKDLFIKYENVQNKKNSIQIPKSMQEGMDILGVNEYEVSLMFNPENDNNLILQEIDENLNDINNFDSDNIIQLYYKLVNGAGQFNNNTETSFSFQKK